MRVKMYEEGRLQARLAEVMDVDVPADMADPRSYVREVIRELCRKRSWTVRSIAFVLPDSGFDAVVYYRGDPVGAVAAKPRSKPVRIEGPHRRPAQ
jgi:hypothetical protein